MSGKPAANGAGAARVLLVVDGQPHDVFDVVEVTDKLVRARSAFLFEVGEALEVRIEQDSTVTTASACVRGHVDNGADPITELELSDRSEPRRVVSG